MTETAHNHTPDVLAEALALATKGIHVLPIKPGHKRPPMTAWQNHATTDPAIIRNWYTGLYANHGIGIATGHNGLFVIDIDEHHPEASGSDTLHQLEQQHGPLPDTWEVETGSGGRHIYLHAPIPINNDAGKRLGPGIDIRGIGGQVLAPPTKHPNGRHYTWLIDHHPDDLPLAEAPPWLLQLLTPIPTPTPTPTRRHTDLWDELNDSPAARYNQTTTWPDLLTSDGWTLAHIDRNGEQHWTRPGKTTKDGTSATVGYNNQDVLVVFTSSLPWLPTGAYSRFGYYACRHHNGDRSAAARELRNHTTTILPTILPTATTTDHWPEPTPIITTPTTPPFPTHTLPTWITNYTQQIADNLQVANDLPNTLALGALSVCTLGNTHIHYQRNDWTQPLNIYAAIALPPSAGKSPAKAAIYHPLETYEQQKLQHAQQQKQHTDSNRRIQEKRLRDLEEKLAKLPPNSTEATTTQHQLAETIHELATTPPATSGRLLADDATTEALGVALAEAGGNLAVISSEGGIFDRMAGLYSEGQINLDLYLEAWSGGRYIVDRIKRDSIQIPSANLVVITTIQPHTLNEIGARKAFAGRGLTARFLLSMPTSNVGTRDRLRHTNTNPQHKTNYENTLTELAQHHHKTKTQLHLNPEADQTFANWDQQLEHQIAPGQPLEHLAEWIGKLRANIIRIAGLLHIADHNPNNQVDAPTMNRAIEIGTYYLTHMTAISDHWGTDQNAIQAQHILEWATRTGNTQFTIRDAMRANRRRFPDLESIRGPLTILIENGWIRPTDNTEINFTPTRGKPSPTLRIHPDTTRLIAKQSEVVGHVGHVAHNFDQKTAKQYEVVGHVGHVAIRGEMENSLSIKNNTSTPHTPGDMTDMTDNSTNDPLNLLD